MTKINNVLLEFISLYIIIGIWRNSTISYIIANIDTILLYIQMFSLISIVGIFLLYKKMKINWVGIFSIILGFINFIITKHTFVLGFAILFVAFSKLDFKTTTHKLNNRIKLTLIIIILLSLLDLIPNLVSFRIGNEARYQLGFTTATLPNSILMFIFLNDIYFYQDRLSIIRVLSYICLSFILHVITDTRTGFVLVIISAIFSLILKKSNRFNRLLEFISKRKFLRFILCCIPIIILLVEIYLVYYYSFFTPLSFKLNELLSTRLSNTLSIYLKYGVSLFGQTIITYSEGMYLGSDICYFYYIFNYGILFVAITIILQSMILKKSLVANDRYLFICMIIILIDGIFEPYLLDYKYQFFTFVISANIFISKNNVTDHQIHRVPQKG